MFPTERLQRWDDERVSRFDGLAETSMRLFGKPVSDLTVAELTELYREHEILPRPRPVLQIVKSADDDTR